MLKDLMILVLPYLPFIGAAVVGASKEIQVSGIISRVLETAIIGAIVLYANVQTINTKLEDARSSITTCINEHKRADSERHRFEIDINGLKWEIQALRKDIDKHDKASQ